MIATLDPKDKNLELHYLKNYNCIYTQDSTDTLSINVLHTKTNNINTLQKQDVYFKCKYYTSHTTSVINQFTIKDDTL